MCSINTPLNAAALRQGAEAKYAKRPATKVLGGAEVQRLVHELQVHQIELEMQIESLQQDSGDAGRLADAVIIKELNEKIEQIQRQLLQSEKMAAIGQLAAGVAHEINSPVGFVHANLGTLKEYITDLIALLDTYAKAAGQCGPSNPTLLAAHRLAAEIDLEFMRDDILKLIDESLGGMQRVKRIVSDLRPFDHVDYAHWLAIDIHSCLYSTLNVIWSELKGEVTLVKEYAELPAITCLPAQLSQVFMNLIINAEQSIKEHGTITLRTGHEADVDHIWVEVADNGGGIAPEHLTRIFEPFFTTKPVNSNPGLGLAICYAIVEMHKGRIEVKSEIGQGTTFRVYLPIQPAR